MVLFCRYGRLILVILKCYTLYYIDNLIKEDKLMINDEYLVHELVMQYAHDDALFTLYFKVLAIVTCLLVL